MAGEQHNAATMWSFLTHAPGEKMCLPLCQEMAVLFIKRFRRTVRWTAIGYYFLSQQGCVMRHSCYSGTNIINKKKEKKTLKDLCSLTAGLMKHADAALLSGPYSRMIIYQLCVKFLWCFLRWMTWTKNDCWAFTTRKSRRVQFKIEDMCETVFAHTAAIMLNVHREPNTSSTKTITDNHSHLMYVLKAVNRTF